ncbi:MAG: hypothetical protein U1E89_17250 [Burkholderiaceae bacterium]
MTRLLILLAAWLVAACASAPPAALPAPPWHDEAFAPPAAPVRSDDVFALSDEMRTWLHTRGAASMRRKGPQKGLLDALYAGDDLKLAYDASRTRNAAEAFASRAGNCLSLVIMTAAFAREVGLQVEFQSAFADETWTRSGGLYFRSGHVNVTLSRKAVDAGRLGAADHTLWTVDFVPPEEIRGLRTRSITQTDVLAMYLNNRAAEALAAGRIDDAYAWSREAVHTQPALLAARNTLGVIYQRRGLAAAAEQVFRQVLALDERHTRAMHNLAQLVAEQGRDAEAAALRTRLAQLEPEPPFHFFDLGQQAMRDGDYRAAREFFAREVARADYSAEFHYWLGLAQYKLGELDAARRQLALARAYSATPREQEIYAAKLAWLKQHAAEPAGSKDRRTQ